MHRKSPRLATLALAAAALLAAGPASAKEIGRYLSADNAFELAVEAAPPAEGLALNRVQSLVVRVVPRDPMQPLPYTTLAFDARMPAHDHGMVTKPKVTQTAPGEFRVDGVKLHMAGKWELSFTLTSPGPETAKVTAPYEI